MNIIKFIFPFCFSQPPPVRPAPNNPQPAPINHNQTIVNNHPPIPSIVNNHPPIPPIVNNPQSNNNFNSPQASDPDIYKYKGYKEEVLPIYNYDRHEKKEIINILGEYINEIYVAKMVMSYSFKYNQCEKCGQYCKDKWILLPCDHYIHKRCFRPTCPRCHEQITV